ncbi:hypothetical protein EDC04DRAFT_2603185 [Pisolithus marmoratus]|nr:hypothetical protein EDC04DRAFT_2603185 [Pisolithus marmoratus]
MFSSPPISFPTFTLVFAHIASSTIKNGVSALIWIHHNLLLHIELARSLDKGFATIDTLLQEGIDGCCQGHTLVTDLQLCSDQQATPSHLPSPSKLSKDPHPGRT